MKLLLALIPLIFAVNFVTAPDRPVLQDPEDEVVMEKKMENNIFAEDNEACFVCHGENIFELTDTVLGVTAKRHMCQDYYIDRDLYYKSNHWSFACTDCHSSDFKIFPHQTFERLEEHYACNDCHAYDEEYAHFQFEKIEEEYIASTHANLEDFSCWKCHDPHSYEINIRTSENLGETILYDNAICLECHGNFSNYELLSDKAEVNLVANHEWLPNESLHFASVRCIECHTEISEDILVAHKLLPKDQAVRRCTECHSSNSRLLSTLYKHQSMQLRTDGGFLNAVILNQSYVVGATPNRILNFLSFIIFGGMFAVIFIHILFRIIKKV